eukprot:s2687_g6.t1
MQVPFLGWIQILVFCGLVDFGLYRADPSRDPGDYENAGILGVPNASGPMADAEGRKRKLNSELANGRLAMMAITGMLFQNGRAESREPPGRPCGDFEDFKVVVLVHDLRCLNSPAPAHDQMFAHSREKGGRLKHLTVRPGL